MSLLYNVLSRLVIAFLPRSKCLLISCLQSSSAVIFGTPKINSLQGVLKTSTPRALDLILAQAEAKCQSVVGSVYTHRSYCCHYYCFSKMVNLGKTKNKAKITMETCLFLFFNYFVPLCVRPAPFIKTSLDTFLEKEKELVAP